MINTNHNQIRDNINTLSEQIKVGEWNNRENVLSIKLDKLITNLLTIDPHILRNDQNLSQSIHSLKGLVLTLSRTTKRINEFTVQALNKIVDGVRLPEKHFLEITKSLPSDGEHLQSSLEVFRNLREHYPAETDRAFANWVSFQHIPLSLLGLSFEELTPIIPYLTFATLDMPLSEAECNFFMENAVRLENLVFQSETIERLPKLPENLVVLICRSEKLKEVSEFNANLRTFICNCDSLVKLPAVCPENLKEMDISDCPQLAVPPRLNDNLIRFSCANCPILEFPYHLNPGLQDFNCSRNQMQNYPVLGQQLRHIESTDCENLRSIVSLPDSLEMLDVRRCHNLERIDTSRNLKKLFMTDCPKANVTEPLPPGLKIKK